MKDIQTFDPSLAISGVIKTNGVNPNEQLMLYNDSIYGLKLTFSDGSFDIIPPAWNKDFILTNIPMSTVRWDLYNTLNVNPASYPANSIYGVLYEPGEHVARVNASMQRGFTITGGAVSVSGNTLVNTGNSVITTGIIAIQPSGDTQNTTTLDNVGNFVNGDTLHPGSIKFDNGAITSDGAGNVLVNNLLMSGGRLGEVTNGDIIDANSANATYIKTRVNGSINFQVPNGTNVASIDTNTGAASSARGNSGSLTIDRVFLKSNGIIGIAGQVNVACAGGTTFTHGLGGTPSGIGFMGVIGQPGSSTMGVGSVGSTTFQGTIGAGSQCVWIGFR